MACQQAPDVLTKALRDLGGLCGFGHPDGFDVGQGFAKGRFIGLNQGLSHGVSLTRVVGLFV